MPAEHIRVTGYVQGVGYRAFVERLAYQLDVFGEVWNTRDDAVEIIAESEEQGTMDRFISSLNRGPGRVESVQHHSVSNRGYSDFRISSTR